MSITTILCTNSKAVQFCHGITIGTIAAIMLGYSAAYPDTVPPSRTMRFTVSSIDEYGLIVSSTGLKFRLFAIVPKQSFFTYANEYLIGHELYCDDAGSTGTRNMLIFDDALKSIDCSPTDSALGRHSDSLQEELIQADAALEYCPESRNQFKTCHVNLEK